MDYQTFAPTPQLSAFVKCFWHLEAPKEARPGKQRIVPDGCMEMIFHYGDHFRQYLPNGDYIIQPKSFVFGQLTLPLDIEPTGETGVFAVRFRPEGFMPFATTPISQMDNRAVPLTELFAEEGLELERNVLTALTTEDRIIIIESFLINKMVNPQAIEKIIKSSIDLMVSINGQLSVADLSRQININRRQLERRFSSVIGLSPKQLAKIIRLQRALKMMLNSELSSLTDLAYNGDYFDQSHFIKDFKEFTGVSPKKFYAGHLKMTALFSGER